MADYLTKVKDPSRTFVQLVEIDLDTCLLTYSIAPCTASGGQCSNTFKTCEDKANFDLGVKTFLFQSKRSPLVLKGLQAIPSLVSVSPVSTEIEPRESITINPRMEFIFDDEPDPQPFNHDKGAGFFHPLRKSTFWKILTSIHPNFRRKPIRLFEGFPDSLKSEYRLKFSGIIENIEFVDGEKVRVTATDEMKKFRELKIPNAISSSNVTTSLIDAVTTTLPVANGDEFKLLSGGFDAYVKIIDDLNGDEYAKMTNISGNDLTIERTGLFGTFVNTHAQGVKVVQVAPFLDDADTGADGDEGVLAQSGGHRADHRRGTLAQHGRRRTPGRWSAVHRNPRARHDPARRRERVPGRNRSTARTTSSRARGGGAGRGPPGARPGGQGGGRDSAGREHRRGSPRCLDRADAGLLQGAEPVGTAQRSLAAQCLG